MDYLFVNDGASILKICENSYAHKTPLILHQPGLKFKAVIVAVNLNAQELVIRPADPSTDFSVMDPSAQLFINNAPNNILFKTNFRGKVRPYFAIIKIPDSLLIRNHRETQRTNFNHIKFPVYFKNFTIFDYQLRNQQIKADIFDLSESGIALKTEVETIQRFKENDKIIFTLVNGYSFTRKVEGRLIYVKEYVNFMHENYYKMGIAFSDDSCGVTFKRFIDNQIYSELRNGFK